MVKRSEPECRSQAASQTLFFTVRMKSTVSGLKVALVLLLFCALQAHADGKKRKNSQVRLYNSKESYDGQFPYAVFHIRRVGRTYYSCTGAIIHEEWVLTAAHCLRRNTPPRENLLVAGKANLKQYFYKRFRNLTVYEDIDEVKFDVQERRASAVYTHPQHTYSGRHDIGLIRTNRPFQFNDKVNAIPLSRDPFDRKMDCTIVGFGLIENNVRKYILQYIDYIPAKPAKSCLMQRNKDVICLGDKNRGICQGDSGGPIVCAGQVRGVASHGLSTSTVCGIGVIEQYYCDAQRNMVWLDVVLRNMDIRHSYG